MALKKEETPVPEPEKPIVKDNGEVEVPLNEEVQVNGQPAPVQETKPVQKTEEERFRNKVYAQDRIINKLQRELEEMRNMQQQPVQQTSQPTYATELDEIDKLAQVDWKAAVNKLAEKKALEIVQKQQLEISKQSEQIEVQNIMDKNAEFVLAKHNELNDPSSEKSIIYQEILNTHPRWRTNPDGPLLVMHEMEDELRNRGYELDSPVNRQENETVRKERAPINSFPPSRPVTNNKFVLTREQKDFCDTHNIPYDEYAKSAVKVGGGKGVEIS